jgi:cytochrome b
MLKIWDISTRIYHWLQAFVFFGLVATAYGGLSEIEGISSKELHARLGLLLVILLVWRIGWGVFGSETSRFTQFLRSPREIGRYLKGQGHTAVGHNPLGALMVVVLITSLFLQGSIGLMMTDWIDGKELIGRSAMRTLGDVHSINSFLLIAFSVLHIIAAIVYRLKGQHLIGAMLTGNVQLADLHSTAKIAAPNIASNRRSLAWFMCSIAVVISVMKLLS